MCKGHYGRKHEGICGGEKKQTSIQSRHGPTISMDFFTLFSEAPLISLALSNACIQVQSISLCSALVERGRTKGKSSCILLLFSCPHIAVQERVTL